MTNFEFIKSLTLDELATLLCDISQGDCKTCLARDMCGYKSNGMRKFLESEVSHDWNE